MDKTLGLSAGRSGVRIPGRGKCSLRTTAIDARVNYSLFFCFLVARPVRTFYTGGFEMLMARQKTSPVHGEMKAERPMRLCGLI